MNSVQTNIMNIAPAPNAAAKTTNAAEAVRPTSQTGATAERGAKNPSFDKALAKLKAAKQDVADMAEAVAKDPLAASLAASGQTQAKPADAADGESSTEAVQGVQTVQTVEESAPVQVSAKSDAGQMPVVSLEIPAALAQETDEPVLMTSPTDEAAAQEVNELSAQEAPLVSSHETGDSAAKPSVQPQGNPASQLCWCAVKSLRRICFRLFRAGLCRRHRSLRCSQQRSSCRSQMQALSHQK